MKSFADWTQELAEANNHEPENNLDSYYAEQDPSYTVDCEGDRCKMCDGEGSVMTGNDRNGIHWADCPACTPVVCSGVGCEKRGVPNYWAGDYEFYCGGSPRCCP